MSVDSYDADNQVKVGKGIQLGLAGKVDRRATPPGCLLYSASPRITLGLGRDKADTEVNNLLLLDLFLKRGRIFLVTQVSV